MLQPGKTFSFSHLKCLKMFHLSRCHPAYREQEAVGRKPRQGSALLVCCTCIPSLCHPCIGSRCTVFSLYSFPLIHITFCLTKTQCFLLQFVSLPVALQISMVLFMAACIVTSWSVIFNDLLNIHSFKRKSYLWLHVWKEESLRLPGSWHEHAGEDQSPFLNFSFYPF